jgi:D-alanyl-lipoteichoic acid acyltransferase DltB (MBOAT superfamily)
MSWKIEYVLIIIASTVSVYTAGILVEKYKDIPRKKWILVITLIFNSGLLFVFKYYNIFNETVRIALNEFNIFYNVPEFKLLLPVGISFYTFQVISYLVDVYRGESAAEKHFGKFAVFVAFFPKLISGPIERARNLLPQFYEQHDFDYQRISDGLKLIAWGLFKKMVIADRLAIYVNQIYDNPGEYSGAPVILATIFFTYQIYCDFSGYTDIARGSAQVLGFRLMENFNRPYYAKSVTEFWRRWHISLSTWLNDYIYTPIVIRKRDWGQAAVLFSIFVTFTLCGLWHGAYWTFIIWGSLHGMMLSLEVITKKQRKKIIKTVPQALYDGTCMLLTFSFICLSFVFFRANTVSDAVLLFNSMVSIDLSNLDIHVTTLSKTELIVAFFSIAVLEVVQLIQGKVQIRQYIGGKKLIYRWAIYVVFVSYILFFRRTGSEFIYFQF